MILGNIQERRRFLRAAVEFRECETPPTDLSVPRRETFVELYVEAAAIASILGVRIGWLFGEDEKSSKPKRD